MRGTAFFGVVLAGVALAAVPSAPPALRAASSDVSVVVYISGDVQTTTTRSAFPEPLVVEAADGSGQPVAGTAITFSVLASQAQATFPGGKASAQAVTGAGGRAASPVLTAGAMVGRVNVMARADDGVGYLFELSVSYPPAATVTIVSGNDQSAVAGGTLPQPLAARALDALGYPVDSGVQMTFRCNSHATFPGGATQVTVPIRAADGTATSPPVDVGPTPGTFTVTAEVMDSPDAPSATFTETATAQPPTLPRRSGR